MSEEVYKPVEAQIVEEKPKKKVAWSLLISGILFVILGIVCFACPLLTLETIALMLGIMFLVGGVGSIVDFAFGGAFRVFSGWLLASGIAEVLLGFVFISHPIFSIAILSGFIAAAILVSGCFQVASAIRLHALGGKSWIFEVVTGVLTIVLAILMFAYPSTLVYWISAYAIVFGVALAFLAFRVPRVINRLTA